MTDATSTVRVLLGHHWGCAPNSGNVHCNLNFDPGAITAMVNVTWPFAGTSVDVQVQRVPAGIAAIAAPTVATTVATVSGGKITVPLTGIGDGDAVSIVVTPRP